MGLNEFLAGNDRIDDVQIVSFTRGQPNFAVLIGPDGRQIRIFTEMRDVGERLELGILKLGAVPPDFSQGEIETVPGGRVLLFEYLAAPGFDFVSGVRIRLDGGDLIILAADMPYSVFVSLGAVERGRPEYPIDDYRTVRPAAE